MKDILDDFNHKKPTRKPYIRWSISYVVFMVLVTTVLLNITIGIAYFELSAIWWLLLAVGYVLGFVVLSLILLLLRDKWSKQKLKNLSPLGFRVVELSLLLWFVSIVLLFVSKQMRLL